LCGPWVTVATPGKFSFPVYMTCRVKLAVNIETQRKVAIKFLRVSTPGISKHKALECLIREIRALADCEHKNVAKIIEASLDGVLVKRGESKTRRKSGVCYYVMRLAEYGELYKFIEHTERFSERLARSLFA